MSSTKVSSGVRKPSSNRGSTAPSSSSKKVVDPLAITPDVVWSHRPGQQQQQQQQNTGGGRRSPRGSNTNYNANVNATAANYQNQNQQPGSISPAAVDPNNMMMASPYQQQQGQQQGLVNSPTQQQQQQQQKENNKNVAKQEAEQKSKAASSAAKEAALQLKTSSTVLSEELAALREENSQLHDIEKQFWIILDEREQLSEEVRNLKNGIRTGVSSSNNNNSAISGSSSSNPLIKISSNPSEVEKNYNQMASALDEALTMLLQLDKTAATRISGSSGSSSSVVVPGTLIHRFLDFVSSERKGGGGISPSSSTSAAAFATTATSPINTTTTGAGGRSGSLPNNGMNQSGVVAHNLLQQALSPASQQHQQRSASTTSASGAGGYVSPSSGTDGVQAVLQASSLSQALRVSQDEIQHLKMELDRSDLSRLQALDDVDKMQNQIKVLSSSIVELRSAYASARAQADANAKAAETVHDVTVRLAERDAEIAHLKARVAEMQRMAASGGNALAADTARIRAELSARSSASK